MSNKIGRFEILSEITRSETGAVYKVSDPESGQTVALKTLQLPLLGDQAGVLVQRILQEAAGIRVLGSHNIAQLFGAEEIDGQFCAAMEYVQGNSIGAKRRLLDLGFAGHHSPGLPGAGSCPLSQRGALQP